MRKLPFPICNRQESISAGDGSLRQNLLTQIRTTANKLPRRFRLGVYQKKNDIRGMSFFFGSPMRNRTADSAVRGQRLNRLTMRPFFIVIEISLFMITYFFVFCKCLYARCGKILKFCPSREDLNIFSKKTFTEILHILFFAIYLRRNHCSGGEYQKESGLFLSAQPIKTPTEPASKPSF